jgi:hypothetical protein
MAFASRLSILIVLGLCSKMLAIVNRRCVFFKLKMSVATLPSRINFLCLSVSLFDKKHSCYFLEILLSINCKHFCFEGNRHCDYADLKFMIIDFVTGKV